MFIYSLDDVDTVNFGLEIAAEQQETPEDDPFALLLPFTDAETVDHPEFQGTWELEEYDDLPFPHVEESELRELVNGNFASFFQQRCGQEFYRMFFPSPHAFREVKLTL